MKHRSAVKKIGKDRKHKIALLRNMATSLLKSEKVLTTTLKAKELKKFVEKLITRAKKNTLHNRRVVYRHLKDTFILKKLFEKIASRYRNRNGGYTRLYKVGRRKGDGAEMSYIELLPADFEDTTIDASKSDSAKQSPDQSPKQSNEEDNNTSTKSTSSSAKPEIKKSPEKQASTESKAKEKEKITTNLNV